MNLKRAPVTSSIKFIGQRELVSGSETSRSVLEPYIKRQTRAFSKPPVAIKRSSIRSSTKKSSQSSIRTTTHSASHVGSDDDRDSDSDSERVNNSDSNHTHNYRDDHHTLQHTANRAIDSDHLSTEEPTATKTAHKNSLSDSVLRKKGVHVSTSGFNANEIAVTLPDRMHSSSSSSSSSSSRSASDDEEDHTFEHTTKKSRRVHRVNPESTHPLVLHRDDSNASSDPTTHSNRNHIRNDKATDHTQDSIDEPDGEHAGGVLGSVDRKPLVLIAYNGVVDEKWRNEFMEQHGNDERIKIEQVNTADRVTVRNRQRVSVALKSLQTKLVGMALVQTLVYAGLVVLVASHIAKMPTYPLSYHFWRRTYTNHFRLSSGSFGSINLGWLMLVASIVSMIRHAVEYKPYKVQFLNEIQMDRTRTLQWIDFIISWPLLFGTVAIQVGLLDLVVWLMLVSYVITVVAIYAFTEKAQTSLDRKRISSGAVVPYICLWIYLAAEFFLASRDDTAPLWVLILLVGAATLNNALISLLWYQSTPPIGGKQIGPLILSPFRQARLLSDQLDSDVERYMRAALYIDIVDLFTRIFIVTMIVVNLSY